MNKSHHFLAAKRFFFSIGLVFLSSLTASNAIAGNYTFPGMGGDWYPGMEGGWQQHHKQKHVSFDIVENGYRFSFDDPLDEDGMPAYGSEFITEGYLYPYGFLETHPDAVNEDGSAAYPEMVLGRWTCKGWHVGEGAATADAPWVVSTQLFDFGKSWGLQSIVTEGYEMSNNAPILRAITGGTGRFKNAKGESIQEFLGFNASGGVNVRVTLKPKK